MSDQPTEPTPAHPADSPGPDWQKISVPLAAALVAVLAIWWYAAAPEDDAFADARSSIERGDDANNERAEGAPQQEVVNGWTTIEYLNLLSAQQEHENNRRDMLLLLILLSGLAGFTFTQARRRREKPELE